MKKSIKKIDSSLVKINLLLIFCFVISGCSESKKNYDEEPNDFNSEILGSWKRIQAERIIMYNDSLSEVEILKSYSFNEIVDFTANNIYREFNYPFQFNSSSEFILKDSCLFFVKNGDLFTSTIRYLANDTLILEVEIKNPTMSTGPNKNVKKTAVRISYERVEINRDSLTDLQNSYVSKEFLSKNWSFDKVVKIYDNGIFGRDLIVQNDQNLIDEIIESYESLDFTDMLNYQLRRKCISYNIKDLHYNFTVFDLSESILILIPESEYCCESNDIGIVFKIKEIRSSQNPTDN